MKLSEHVIYAIDDAGAGKFNSALLHACIAIDSTARRLYPIVSGVGKRYVDCLREYYWIVEPMLGSGINIVDTRFTNIKLKNTNAPDIAEIIYEIFRCNHAHGDEVPLAFSVTQSHGPFLSRWKTAAGELHMPDRIIWALLGVAVFSKVNKIESTTGSYYLSLGTERFPIAEWWGREDDFRQIAERYSKVRVKMEGL